MSHLWDTLLIGISVVCLFRSEADNYGSRPGGVVRFTISPECPFIVARQSSRTDPMDLLHISMIANSRSSSSQVSSMPLKRGLALRTHCCLVSIWSWRKITLQTCHMIRITRIRYECWRLFKWYGRTSF